MAVPKCARFALFGLSDSAEVLVLLSYIRGKKMEAYLG